MKSLSRAVVLSSALLIIPSVHALEMPDLDGVYYHLSYSSLNVEISNVDGSGDATYPAISFELGKGIYNFEIADIYLEGFFILGLDDEEVFTYGSGNLRYRSQFDAAVGVQLKAHKQIASDIAVHFNLGLINLTTSVYNENCIASSCVSIVPVAEETSTGLNYAIGGEYQIDTKSAITLSYSQLFSDDVGISDVDITSLSIGYKKRF